MKTQRKTVYIADDGTEHQTRQAAQKYEQRLRIINLLGQRAAYNALSPEDAADVLLENGTYKFNKA